MLGWCFSFSEILVITGAVLLTRYWNGRKIKALSSCSTRRHKSKVPRPSWSEVQLEGLNVPRITILWQSKFLFSSSLRAATVLKMNRWFSENKPFFHVYSDRNLKVTVTIQYPALTRDSSKHSIYVSYSHLDQSVNILGAPPTIFTNVEALKHSKVKRKKKKKRVNQVIFCCSEKYNWWCHYSHSFW